MSSERHHETCHFAGKTFDETHGCPSHCTCPILNEDGPDGLKVMGVLTGQVLHSPPWPVCNDHREQSHREDEPPYCKRCGWNRGRTSVPPRQIAKPNGGWGTP